MDRILNEQCRTLATGYIDYYLLHALGKNNWQKLVRLDVLEFLDTAKRDGRIRNTGFSFHGDPATFKEIVDAYDWQFCQIQYNFLDEHNQAGTEGLRYAAAKNLAVIVMEPLRGGNLACTVPDEIRRIWGEAQEKRSPAEWGLRWVWDHQEVTIVLSGMNNEAHIDENIRVASEALPGSLSAQERALVGRVRDTYRRLMKVGCTGCGYCMPCPAGVNIPECFSLYNSRFLFPGNREIPFKYIGHLGGVLGNRGYAGLCRRCGKCERNCPQHLPVPNLLKEVSATMEGRTMGIKVLAVKGALWCMDQAGRISRAVAGSAGNGQTRT
jgi:predicted aldo/keto reductase-like oxidoreductase